MAQGLKLFAEIVPDTKGLKTKLKGEKLKMEGTVEEGKGIGIGGTAVGSGMGVAMGMGIFSIFQKILGFIMGLEPIQAIMEMIGAIMKLFFLPLALMLFTLLRPILIPMLKLMPMWMKFWQDPVGNLIPLIKKLGEFLVKGITGFAKAMPGAVGKLTEMNLKLPEMILKALGIDFPLARVGGLIAEALMKIIPAWFSEHVFQPLFKVALWFGLNFIKSILWFYKWIVKPFIDVTLWGAGAVGGALQWFYDNVIKPFIGVTLWGADKLKGAFDWLLGLPEWISGLWADITEYDLPSKIKSAIGELGDIFMDTLAGIVKVIYDVVNKLPFIHFSYPDWVQKQLSLGKYKNEELPYAGEFNPDDLSDKPKFWYEPPVDDFILSKGRVYRTNPRDTIMGTKTPGGFSNPRPIYLYVNGVMSDALLKQTVFMLRREMQRGVYSG